MGKPLAARGSDSGSVTCQTVRGVWSQPRMSICDVYARIGLQAEDRATLENPPLAAVPGADSAVSRFVSSPQFAKEPRCGTRSRINACSVMSPPGLLLSLLTGGASK